MLLSLLSSAHDLQEVRDFYHGPLKEFIGEQGLQDGSWHPRVNLGHLTSPRGALAMWDHIYPLSLLSRTSSWGGRCRTAGMACPQGTTSWGSQINTQAPSVLSLSPALSPTFIPSSTPVCPLPSMFSHPAGDTRAPGESQQPGWGPVL